MAKDWYGVRSVFHMFMKESGVNVFEERVVCFEAASYEELFEKSAREAERYARGDGSMGASAHPDQISYQIDAESGAKLVDGLELWSQLFEFRGTLEEFYSKRYDVYEFDLET